MKSRADEYAGQIRFPLNATGRSGLMDWSICGACCTGPSRFIRKMQIN
jgi:hypothetical protein